MFFFDSHGTGRRGQQRGTAAARLVRPAASGALGEAGGKRRRARVRLTASSGGQRGRREQASVHGRAQASAADAGECGSPPAGAGTQLRRQDRAAGRDRPRAGRAHVHSRAHGEAPLPLRHGRTRRLHRRRCDGDTETWRWWPTTFPAWLARRRIGSDCFFILLSGCSV
jgi:hypothetical protein